MSICKIGETKVINGSRYRKCPARNCCEGCVFSYKYKCRLTGSPYIPIEHSGSECDGTIWILADDQPEAPTATPPRDELREQRRFEAAKAAMQGMCASNKASAKTQDECWAEIARIAAGLADALLAELDRTGEGK